MVCKRQLLISSKDEEDEPAGEREQEGEEEEEFESAERGDGRENRGSILPLLINTSALVEDYVEEQ